ncbi:MAG: hypothetical protein JSV04_06965 [Candidatus Heimdallarchaeota archaeon]|nr:MAG: hypothetical protein JSV04_06965 [Candidatus Heimdallarchaeota archaeon]
MSYHSLTKAETYTVETSINDLLNSTDMTRLLESHSLIKIHGRRNDVYLVQPEDLLLLEKFSIGITSKNYSLIHVRIKLGFFIHENFLIGIESLNFLAPLTKKKVHLDDRATQQFIYGKDIEITTASSKEQIADLQDQSTIMVFSPNDLPLGYAKFFNKETNPWLQNLVDIGIYLRSEKSAF